MVGSPKISSHSAVWRTRDRAEKISCSAELKGALHGGGNGDAAEFSQHLQLGDDPVVGAVALVEVGAGFVGDRAAGVSADAVLDNLLVDQAPARVSVGEQEVEQHEVGILDGGGRQFRLQGFHPRCAAAGQGREVHARLGGGQGLDQGADPGISGSFGQLAEDRKNVHR